MLPLPLDHKNERGFILLFSVIIMGAVGLAISLYLISSGLNTSQNSFILEQSAGAKALANACAEIGLSKIQNCTSTIGNFNLDIGDGNCEYNILQSSDTGRTVNAIGTVGDMIRKIKIEVGQIEPNLQVNSWQEVAQF